jgi:hypothetical protein
MPHGTACRVSPAGREVQAGSCGLSPWEFLVGLAMNGVGFFREFVQAVEKVTPTNIRCFCFLVSHFSI